MYSNTVSFPSVSLLDTLMSLGLVSPKSTVDSLNLLSFSFTTKPSSVLLSVAEKVCPNTITGTEAGQLIYMWINIAAGGAFDTIANKGFAIRIGTDTSNYRDYTIAGSNDTNGWTGGWKLFVVNVDETQVAGYTETGTFNKASVRTFGVWIDTAASVRADSIWLDQIAVGDGLRVLGSSTTSMKDIVAYCTDFANRAWGMFQQREGIYYSYGKLYIGSDTQTAITSFKDDGNIIQYGDSQFWNGSAWVSTYGPDDAGVILDDATGFATYFEDGILVGTDNGRAGSVFNGNDDQDVFFNASSLTNAASYVKLYGTQFVGFKGGIVLHNDADSLFYAGVVTKSGQFDSVGAPKIRNCVFSGTVDSYSGGLINGAALLWNANIDIQDCQFIANVDVTSNPHGIEHPAAGTFTYTGLVFSGNDKQILFTAATLDLNITATGGTNVSGTATDHTIIGTGTINVSNPITLTITGLQTGSEINILRAGTQTAASSTDASDHVEDSGVTHAYNYNYPPSGYTHIDVFINKPGYIWYPVRNLLVAASNGTLPVQQILDRNED